MEFQNEILPTFSIMLCAHIIICRLALRYQNYSDAASWFKCAQKRS